MAARRQLSRKPVMSGQLRGNHCLAAARISHRAAEDAFCRVPGARAQRQCMSGSRYKGGRWVEQPNMPHPFLGKYALEYVIDYLHNIHRIIG